MTLKWPCCLQGEGPPIGDLGTLAMPTNLQREGLERFGGPPADLPKEVHSL